MQPPAEATFRRRVVVLQIITAAMTAGLLILAAVAVFVRLSGNGPPVAGIPVISYVALGAIVFGAAASFLVPPFVERSILRQVASGVSALSGKGPRLPAGDDSSELFGVAQAGHIVGCALLEGPGFIAAIAYMLEGTPWAVGLVAVPLSLLALRFPTADRVRSRLDDLAPQLTAARHEIGTRPK